MDKFFELYPENPNSKRKSGVNTTPKKIEEPKEENGKSSADFDNSVFYEKEQEFLKTQRDAQQRLNEEKEKILEKKIEEVYSKSERSISKEHWCRLCKLKPKLELLKLSSDINTFFVMHPELENKTPKELEQILDKGKNKNDKALASQESLVWKIICLLEQEHGENFSIQNKK